jgi:hypothetical protein
MWPISTAVNKVANDNLDLQTPVGPVSCAERRAALDEPRQRDLFG